MFSSTLLLTTFVASVFAQSTTLSTTSASTTGASTTITAILAEAPSGFAASIVNADSCQTVIALQCTDDTQCTSTKPLTITQGPSTYAIQTGTQVNGVSGSVSIGCNLQGPVNSWTSASCQFLISGSANGKSVSTSTTSAFGIPNDDFTWGAVPVTAGATALASATGTCTSSKGAAATGSVRKDVYKVLVPIMIAGALV